MQRNPLFQQSTLTPEERRDEANRICMMLSNELDALTPKERDFVESLDDGREITPRMLYWLRDIKDKYL